MDAGLPRLEFEAHGRIASAVAKIRRIRAFYTPKPLFPADSARFHLRRRLKTDRLLGRFWEMPRWSADGRQVVAISTAVRDDRYVVGDMQVILLDAATWKHRMVSSGEGVKIFPFFSADGKTVYYFKGRKRETGATLASWFDLYAIDLASGREDQLTKEEFYEVRRGVVAGNNAILLVAAAGKHLREQANMLVLLLDLAHKRLDVLPIERTADPGKAAVERNAEAIFHFGRLEVDSRSNLYFIAAKLREGGGPYRWFVFKASPEGKAPAILTELPISMGFDIARNTGEIYVMDKQDEELVIRRLRVRADH